MDKNLGNQCTADDDSVFHESLEGENKSKEGDSQESCLDKFCNMARSPKSHGSSTLHSNNAPRNAQDKGNELEILNGCNFTPTENLRGDISQPYLSIILDALQTKFKDVYRTIEAGFAKLAYSDSPPQWFLKYIETNKLCPAFENQIPHSCHCFSHDKAAESDKQQRFKSEQQAIETLLRRALTELEVTKDELRKLESQSSRHTEEILMLKERYRDLQEVLDHKETTLMGSSPQSTLLKNEGASDQAVEVENSFREDFQKVQGQLSTTVKGKDSILSNNQKIKALTQSLESERYELGETIGESCQKISQLGESVPNQEEALDLLSNINSAAKSGTVATEPAFSECNTRASSFNQTNIKPTDKPTYPSDYAKVYKLMSEKELPVPIGLEKFRFCQPLLNKCQQDYEKQTNGEEETVSVQKALDELNILQEVLLPKALQEPDTEEKKGELLVDPDTRNVKEKCNLLGKVRDAKEIPKLGEIYQDLQQDLEKNETILTDSSLQSAFVTNEGALDQPVEVEHCLKEDLQKVQNQQYATVKDAVLSKTIVTDTASEGERDLQINLTENQIIQREEQEEGNNIDRVDLLSASVAASALGKWEKHTKGIGSKIMAKLGYVMGSGLGKHGEGRTEPVEAIVLPRGKSLDHCMEIKEKAKGKRLLRVKKGSKRKSLIGKEQEIKFIKEQTGEENHFLFSFDLLKTRTSSGITDNQKMKVPIRSLQSERNELGETVDESCQNISQLGESVLNEEEALDLPSNMVGAAKSGIVATEHPLLECNTKASSFNQTNIKNLEIATEDQLNKLICDRLTKKTVSNFIRWLFLKNFKKIDAKKKLDILFHVLRVKAVNEQICSRNYTELCKLMFEIEVPMVSGTGIVRLLLDRCQQTFENQKKYEEEITSKRKALREADTEEKKKELQMELDENSMKLIMLYELKLIMLGNIRFFGEFFKLKTVTIENVNFCISELLKSRTEEHLECLCKFVSTIGKTYEEEYDAKFKRAAVEAKSSGKQMHIQLTKLDVYLDEMRKLSQSEGLSSGIRLMLMEVLDLKRHRWVPHREGEKPKTIVEIRGRLQKEKLEKKSSLQENIIKQPQMRYPSQRRDGGRSNESKKSNNHEINTPNRFLKSERQGQGENIDESCLKIPHLKESVLNEEEVLNLSSIRTSASKSGIVPTKSAFSKSDIRASSLYQTKVKNFEIAIAQKLKLETLMHDHPKKIVNDVMKTLIGFKIIDAEKKLDVLVHVLYVKATGKPICALEYAKLCKLLSERGLPGGPRKVSFRQLLLNRCQQSFEKQMKDKEETVSILNALQDADTEEKKAKLLVKLNKRKEEEKRNLLGNVRFTGELFKLKIFKIEVMNFFLSELLRSRTEEHLECLCELVSTIGKTHEEESNGYHQFHLTNLDVYLDEMRKLSRSTNLSSAIRFMLIDVLELKERAWVPIRNEEYCRQSSSLSGNQEVKAPTQSLELERYELEGTIDESCHKVSQLGESVLNQEEALNLSRNKSIAAKSGIVATEPVVLDRYSRVGISNQTNVKNLKTNIVLQLNRLICDSPKKMDVSNFTGWLFHSNFIEIDAEKKIDVLVHVMYVKVTEKPEYAPKLAEVLKLLSEKEVPLVRGRGKVSLCQLIVNRCQQTFERHINSKEKIVSKQEALREAETEEKKAELLVKPDERIAKEKQVLLGFIRFAGELFNSKMLTIETMDFCISELLKLRTEGQLECLCELLSLIGKSYEQEYDAKYQRAVAESENKSQPLQFQLTKLDVYLNEMRGICGGKSTDVVSRIRIMLTDVLDLKERAWVPHQNEENCQKEKRKRDRSSRKTDDS